MQKEVTITAFTEPRSGLKDNREWTMQDVAVTWKEENYNHEMFDQTCLFTVSGKVDQEKLKKALEEGMVLRCRMYFSIRTFNERLFPANRMYLPEEFYLKAF